MATTYTASAASGYMTNVILDAPVGPFRCFTAHYSAPNAATALFTPGMCQVVFASCQDADPTTFQQTANAVGGINCEFSGLVTGSTGYVFILGF